MVRNKKISVWIIERNHVFRESLTAIINSQKDMVVVFSAVALEDYVNPIDVVLLRWEISDTFLNHRQAQAENHCKILVIDAEPSYSGFLKHLQNGARGFVFSSSNKADITDAIRIVAAGGLVIPNQVLSIIGSETAHENKHSESSFSQNVALTNKERQIAQLASVNLTNKEIAEKLNISVGTAKAHIHKVLKKLGLQKRAHIANFPRKEQEDSYDPRHLV